ncbi:MAG: acyl-CoA dehydrogenase family protein [Candidatus Binatia bacterium]
MAQPSNFGFGEEEQMVRASSARLLKDQAGIERLRELVARDHHAAYEAQTPPAAYDEALWRRMVDLGLSGLAVPESAGGAGMNMAAVAALAEEIGRAALPSPMISSLIATFALRAAGDRARPWLERIVGGEPAALATTDARGSWEPGDTDVTSRNDGEGAVLSGTASFVQDARKAGFFVVSARSAAGSATGLFCVPADAPGVTVQADRIVDLTRDQARVELASVEVPAAGVLTVEGGIAALEAALPAMLVVVSADLCGAAEWQLQTTAEYARTRTQFDRPIGFFQAVKHPIVNMMIDIDRARSLTYDAACAVDHEPENALRRARMAKSAASDMAAFCSGRSVQLHGGIGFTWECDVHIYFKRQKHNQQLLGDGVYQRARLAELL